MDTYSCSKLDVEVDVTEMVIKGACAGCREADCAFDGRGNRVNARTLGERLHGRAH